MCSCASDPCGCATEFQKALDAARACIACVGVGQYSTKVEVVTRIWSDGVIGSGTVSEQVVELVPRPKVGQSDPRYNSDVAGKAPKGSRQVSGVSATYTEDELADYDLAPGIERYYLLNGKPYRLESEPIATGVGWKFRLSRMRARPAS